MCDSTAPDFSRLHSTTSGPLIGEQTSSQVLHRSVGSVTRKSSPALVRPCTTSPKLAKDLPYPTIGAERLATLHVGLGRRPNAPPTLPGLSERIFTAKQACPCSSSRRHRK